jgi:chromosome segregation ATPase
MKKMLIVGLIGAVALFVIAKKTNVFSYGSTFISQVATDAKNQVPTKFELDRIRNEIAALDGDISQMIRPIAEYKADIEKLRKDIAKSSGTLDEKKQVLLGVVEKLEGNPKEVRCGNKLVPAERVKIEVQRQTENLKLLEKNVKAQQQMLEAKETSLKATQEQLSKVVTKKREYEVRLAQLEAMDQSLQVQRIASDIKIDTSRTTQIEDALQGLEKRLAADGEELRLRANDIANLNLFEREPEPLDLNVIRGYLEGNEAPAKVANNK